MKKVFYSLLFALIIVACNRHNIFEGYDRSSEGFYYKLLGIGDGNESPKTDEILVTDAVMKTLSDSVFWDTYHDASNGLYIDLNAADMPGSCRSQLLKLVEGDSASFYLKSDVFFRLFFDTIVPSFCKKDSLIKIDLRINQIISKYDLQAIKYGQALGTSEDTELEELQSIDCYLLAEYPKTKVDANGLYWLEHTKTNGEKVSGGKRIKIEFQGSFMDGKPLDVAPQQLEFTYGTPDQIINGLNIVIGQLKEGETAKIIVPSRLAFGEFGSSNGSVPPYMPLVYNIKLIEIK